MAMIYFEFSKEMLIIINNIDHPEWLAEDKLSSPSPIRAINTIQVWVRDRSIFKGGYPGGK